MIQTKDFAREDKALEEYKQMFTKTENFSLIGTMIYGSESGEFIWIGTDNNMNSYTNIKKEWIRI